MDRHVRVRVVCGIKMSGHREIRPPLEDRAPVLDKTVSQSAAGLPYVQMATSGAPDTVYHPSRLAGEVVSHLKGLAGASDGGEGRSVGACVALFAYTGISA